MRVPNPPKLFRVLTTVTPDYPLTIPGWMLPSFALSRLLGNKQRRENSPWKRNMTSERAGRGEDNHKDRNTAVKTVAVQPFWKRKWAGYWKEQILAPSKKTGPVTVEPYHTPYLWQWLEALPLSLSHLSGRNLSMVSTSDAAVRFCPSPSHTTLPTPWLPLYHSPMTAHALPLYDHNPRRRQPPFSSLWRADHLAATSLSCLPSLEQSPSKIPGPTSKISAAPLLMSPIPA